MKEDENLNEGALEHPALQVLLCFFNRMNEWEWGMINEDLTDIDDSDEDRMWAEIRERRTAARTRLADIFEEHCVERSGAKRVNDTLHWGTSQPVYDVDRERIVSVTERGNKVVIETQMTHGFQFRVRYEVVHVDGEWRIRDNRRALDKYGSKKWKVWPL